MNEQPVHFRLNFPNGTKIADVYRAVLEASRRELKREPRRIRFKIRGEDGRYRHHDFGF